MSESVQEQWRFLIAVFVLVILLAALTGLLISLPPHAGWVDQWGLYTLCSMVGFPAIGFVGCIVINDFRKQDLDTGLLNPYMWLFWLASIVLLAGYLISRPHVGDWFVEWFWLTIAGAFFIMLLVGSLIGSDERNSGYR